MKSLKGNLSEAVPYNRGDFPIFISKSNLPKMSDYSINNHWHNDVEFIKVISGSIKYCINGNTLSLKEGDGIFINSNQFHYNFLEKEEECVFICIVFQPTLLCSSKSISEKYIMPIATNPSLPYYKLSSLVKWEKNVLDAVEKIYNINNENAFELKLHNIFFGMWTDLFEHLNQRTKKEPSGKHHLSALKNMISFIQQHYKEKIGLCDIALSGNVCTTSCYTIFKDYTNQTPCGYLNEYRLRKSIDLMKNTDMTLTEICYEVGFSGASYFAECFKQTFKCSPSKYRKNSELI